MPMMRAWVECEIVEKVFNSKVYVQKFDGTRIAWSSRLRDVEYLMQREFRRRTLDLEGADLVDSMEAGNPNRRHGRVG